MGGRQAGSGAELEPNFRLGFLGLAETLLLFWEPRLPLGGLELPEEEVVPRETFDKSRLQLATVAAWNYFLL